MVALHSLKSEWKRIALPGRYRVTEWGIDRRDDKGRLWTVRAQGGRAAALTFEVDEGRDASLSIGEPLVSRLSVRSTGDNHSFQQELNGSLGERITLSMNGNDRPGPPKVHIVANNGSYDRTLNFAYG